MAIDFSKPAISGGLDFSKEVARIPKKVEPIKQPEPEPIVQADPLTNARDLYAGRGFKRLEKY